MAGANKGGVYSTEGGQFETKVSSRSNYFNQITVFDFDLTRFDFKNRLLIYIDAV
jgi:hypothetical protein